MKNYKILIVEQNSEPYTIDLTTDRLEWSMEQYGRNRYISSYKVLEIDGNKTNDSSSI